MTNVFLFQYTENDRFEFSRQIEMEFFKIYPQKEPLEYYVSDEKGNFSNKKLTHGQIIDEFERAPRTFYNVFTKKMANLETSEPKLRHDDYKVAFSSPVKGGFASDSKRLSELIKYMNRNVNDLALHSPAISIVQSSGSGKTKLACSIVEHFPTAYIVFRESNSITFPEKNYIGDLFMKCKLSLCRNGFTEKLADTNIGTYCTLILSILRDYLEKVKEKIAEDSNKSPKLIKDELLREFILGTFKGTNLEKLEHEIKIESEGFNVCRKVQEHINGNCF